MFDFNTAETQRTLIPTDTVALIQLDVKCGGVGDGGWLTNRDDRPLRLPLSFHRLDSGRENAFRFLSGLPSEHAPASDASLT